MRKTKEGIIFDMDGTLYPLDHGRSTNFAESQFGRQIYENAVYFFMNRFGMSRADALTLFTDIKTRFNGEVSLGVEKELQIPRSEYFASTWDLDPQEFVEKQNKLEELLSRLTIQTGVLSAAPRIWIERVLSFLNLREVFGQAIFSGEPDIRKPNPQAFNQIAEFWQIPPSAIISIGDQEESDILPAQSLGMTTVRIGKDIQTAADFTSENVMSAIALLKKEGVI